MNALSMFTKNMVEVNYDALPADVVEATKKQVLDTIGVTIAGSMSTNIRQLADIVKDWGGKEESTILGYGGKVPCCSAALVNGWSAAVLDYDDLHDLDLIHCSQGVFPATFAVAERDRANGKDFMVALALGFDLACRLARAVIVGSESGFLNAPNFFGAAAAAGKLLRLDEEKLKNALGIALMQVCGTGYGIREALNTKGLDSGFHAKGGVLAALMAEKGLAGSADPFEDSRWGLYAMFHRNIYRPELLTVDLGKVFEVTTNGIKPYPSCRVNHASIKAALELVNEHDIKPDDVAEVTVHHGPKVLAVAAEERRRPQNAIHVQHSLIWNVANAIVYRKVGIEHFTEEAIQDKKVLEMTDKIFPKLNPELSHLPFGEVIVEIKSKSGKFYSKRVGSSLPGGPDDPMSFDDVTEKFKDCCNYSAKPVSRENQDKIIQMIERLEDVTDIGQIADLLG